MTAYQGREADKTRAEYEKASSEYEIILKFSVNDPRLLWKAAGRRLQDKGFEAEDIDDTIGPIDDPSIQDCLTMLTMPEGFDGCRLEHFDVHSGTKPALVLTQNEVIPQDRPVPARPLPLGETADDTDWRTSLDAPAICVTSSLITSDRALILPN